MSYICEHNNWDWKPSTIFAERFQQWHLWQPFTFWLVHGDAEHLFWDALYLAIVGLLTESIYGRWRFIGVFLGGSAAGGLLALFCDSRYDSLIGSSDGSHCVASYLCCRIMLASETPFGLWITAGVWWLYLIYLSIWGICFGVMGWPMGYFRNGGFDHLAGITFGGLVAVVDSYVADRRALQQ